MSKTFRDVATQVDELDGVQQQLIDELRGRKTMTDYEIIQKLTEVRAVNNRLWMRLLRIAVEHAPAETKDVLRQINGNDRAISDLLAELAK